MLLEARDEDVHLLVAFEATKAARGFEDADEDPAKDHRAVVPTLHTARRSANASVHVLDRVRGRERAREPRRKTEAHHGERLVETFAKRRSRARMFLLQRASEIVQEALRSLDLRTLVCFTHRAADVGVSLVGKMPDDV